MASVEVLGCNGVSKNGIMYCKNENSPVGSCNDRENENLGESILDDLDSYMEDIINDRLAISRMVSDSVIKGAVTAISQEANERVAAKELEVDRLKEALCARQLDCREGDGFFSRRKHGEQVGEGRRESLRLLQQVAKEQLEELGKFMVNSSELSSATDDVVKLSGSVGQNLRTSGVDKAFNSLKSTVETLCQQADAVTNEWEPEPEICGELEGMIFSTVVHSLQDEHERQLFDVTTIRALIDRCKEISDIRRELKSIQKTLVGPEAVHLSPQVSLDADHFCGKFLNNHLSDGNGNCEESKTSMPENFEKSKLSHMSKQELYQFFRTEITIMKRDHESDVHRMTDEYFRLKRELLKEREGGPLAAFKKDKDFELLKKKMSEVMSKLEYVLKENDKLSEFCNHSRDTLDSLISENHRLRDLLNSQKLETCYVSMQASDAMSQHSSVQENLERSVGFLESSLEDSHLEASITAEVYNCLLKGASAELMSHNEDVEAGCLIMQVIIKSVYEEAFQAVNVVSETDCEEISDFQSTLMQEIYWIVLQEARNDLLSVMNDTKDEFLKEREALVLLESRFSKIEEEMNMEIEENDKLKYLVSDLEKLNVDKDKSVLEVTERLYELQGLREEQDSLLEERHEELVLLKRKLEDSQKCVSHYAVELDRLNEALASSEVSMRECDEEKTRVIAAFKQQQNYLALVNANDGEHQKQMQVLCYIIEGLSNSIADFEFKTDEILSWHSSRLEHSAFQIGSLVPKANILRRTSLLYKERLEKKSTDLQKAEAEVDLLGDEVDALLSLLEKIYVALDHYSPVLQHYPGIIEILKLVRRELGGACKGSISAT